MFKKNFGKIIYKDLTAISCQIKALNSFTNALYETKCTFSQHFKAIGLQKISKISKRNSSQIEFEFFLVKFPLRPELVFLSPFVF